MAWESLGFTSIIEVQFFCQNFRETEHDYEPPSPVQSSRKFIFCLLFSSTKINTTFVDIDKVVITNIIHGNHIIIVISTYVNIHVIHIIIVISTYDNFHVIHIIIVIVITGSGWVQRARNGHQNQPGTGSAQEKDGPGQQPKQEGQT